MSDDVYKRLAKHLSSLGMGYPEKEELLEILKENFTPLEAEVALAIPTKVIPLEPVPVAKIPPPQNVSMEELESILSNLAQRGLLFSKKMKDGSMSYALQQFGYGLSGERRAFRDPQRELYPFGGRSGISHPYKSDPV